MLIKFNDIVERYKRVPKGIIHIGGHTGEEIRDYYSAGVKNVVWVEANPAVFEMLHNNTARYPGNVAYNALISDKDGEQAEFNITNNGESSSMLKLDRHKQHHPHIHVVGSMNLLTKTFDTLAKEKEIDTSKYDFLNMDIQGAELMALKGMEETLKSIDMVYTEVNSGEVYTGCAKINEIDEFLSARGFERVETRMTEYEWGDALYIRKPKT
jgi:FkbM family methyltransferase